MVRPGGQDHCGVDSAYPGLLQQVRGAAGLDEFGDFMSIVSQFFLAVSDTAREADGIAPGESGSNVLVPDSPGSNGRDLVRRQRSARARPQVDGA